MSIICARDNRAVANLGYTNICFIINGPFDMLFCHFRYFDFSNTDMSFVKKDEFSKFYYVTKFYDLETFHSKIAVL